MPNHAAPDTAVSAKRLWAIDELLGRYGTSRIGAPHPIDEGVLNENFRVETPGGPLFVRLHRPTTTVDSLGLEHDVMGWAGARGIPVNLPLATADGATFCEIGGRLWALYPWLEPRHLPRGTTGGVGAYTLGEMLGRLDATLADFTDERLPGDGGLRWDTEQALAELRHIQRLSREDSTLGEHAAAVHAAIAWQIGLLESGAARSYADFERLSVQPVHGDYHDFNVILDAQGQIAAVVDWERVRRELTVYNLLRCLCYCELLEPPLLEAFVTGYRRHASLSPEEAELGVELWWQTRLHTTWVYRTRFIENDRRVDRFLGAEATTQRWFGTAEARTRLAQRLAGSRRR